MVIGDCVKLNSGGPIMTVVNIFEAEGKKRVACTWFESVLPEGFYSATTPREATFAIESLYNVDKPA